MKTLSRVRKHRAFVFRSLDVLVTFFGILAIGVCVLRYGFNLAGAFGDLIQIISPTIIVVFVSQEFIRIVFSTTIYTYFRNRWFEVLAALLGLFYFSGLHFAKDFFIFFHPDAKIIDVVLMYLAISHFFILLKLVTERLRGMRYLESISLGPTQIFILSFLIPIGVGSLLLKLPKATVGSISWVDAFFTATSAVCVTGLVVVPTETTFTGLGKLIICGLFQVGGLGMMTLTVFFSSFLSGHLGVGEKSMLSNWLSVKQLGRVGELLTQIFIFTFTIEIIGAIALYLSGGNTFSSFKPFSFYESVFHAVSAFCNAGFSLSPHELNAENLLSNLGYPSVIMILIVLGGLGFPVISNFWQWIRYRSGHLKRSGFSFSVHTKLVFYSTVFFLVLGTAFIFFLEKNESFKDLSNFERVFHSLFWSVTSRTAGFNIWPTDALSTSTIFVLICFMWVGASPSSTGGGVKNVTVTVAFLEVISQVRGHQRVSVFGREISQESIRRSFTMIFLSLVVLSASVFTVLFLEPHINRVDLVFEVVSAWGTVGLSRGITSHLQEITKIFLIGLMIVGRVGLFSILISMIKKRKQPSFELPKEPIIIH